MAKPLGDQFEQQQQHAQVQIYARLAMVAQTHSSFTSKGCSCTERRDWRKQILEAWSYLPCIMPAEGAYCVVGAVGGSVRDPTWRLKYIVGYVAKAAHAQREETGAFSLAGARQ